MANVLRFSKNNAVPVVCNNITKTALSTRAMSFTPVKDDKNLYLAGGAGGRSSVSGTKAALFGATGFVGRYVASNIGKTGGQACIANRGCEDEVRHLKVAYDLGMFASKNYSIKDDASVENVMYGMNTCVNMIGKYYETRGFGMKTNFTFEDMHIEAPAKLARIAKKAGVKKFIHFSAMAADKDSDCKFAKTKALGEEAVLAEFPEATIIKPNVIFGPEDRLLNWYAIFAEKYGYVPMIHGGKALIQPVYSSDVAAAVTKAIELKDMEGKIIECNGPEEFTYKELADFVYDITSQTPNMVPVEEPFAQHLGKAMGMAPYPMLGEDEVAYKMIDQLPTSGRDEAKDKLAKIESLGELKYAPSVVSEKAELEAFLNKSLQLEDIGITPVPVVKVAFNYLHRFRAGGHFTLAEGYH